MSDSEGSSSHSKEDLLELLKSHGQDFLASFGSLPGAPKGSTRKKRKLSSASSSSERSSDSEGEHLQEENDWTGFNSDDDGVSEDVSDSGDGLSEEGGESEHTYSWLPLNITVFY